MATIGGYYLQVCTTAARTKGIDTNSLMQVAGISPTLTGDKTRRIADSSMVQLLRLLVKYSDDAFLGFARKPVSPQFFELLLQSLAYCQTLQEALTTLQTAFSLAGCELTVSQEQEELRLAFAHEHSDPDHFLLEYLLVFIHRILSWLVARPLILKRAEMSYMPRQYREEFSLLFRCPLAFEQPHNALVLNAQYQSLAITRQRDEFVQVIRQFPLIVLRYPGEETQFNRQVYRLLVRRFVQQQTLLDASQVAIELGISTATLRRQLAALMTSFGQIKTDFRKEQGLLLLQHPDNTIEDIAHRLGYSEARAFSRVFKQWTGLTPSQYRQLL